MSADKRNAKPSSDDIATVDRNDFPVVGIGASAGGLEACTGLLNSLPQDLGMAYVFIMHLDPVRESAFRDILARSTSMPVLTVEDGMKVQPNHAYVIPKNCEMTMEERVLHLTHRLKQRPVNTTIDIFLRSLAVDQKKNAIGVILSGTASDGTMGLAAVKAEGGITIAQDSSAKYDGMPASAVAAGCVDMVLPPDGIARELVRVSRHLAVLGTAEEPEAVGTTKEKQLSQIFSLLLRATRVDFSEYKPPTVQRRVGRRMALHKIEKLGDYVALLQRDRNEVMSLYQDLLINVTSFFRDPEAFDALKRVVYPELLKDRDRSSTVPIRVWVPGCSTGEETYSHAIALVEYLDEQRTEIPIQIFGTDLSDAVIQRARAGIYKQNIEADLSPVRLRRFFHRVESGYQISKTIRDLCIFSTQNVFSDPPFSRIDLVSCRNVMIYLRHTLQRRVIPIVHYALNSGGFLMIGNTEGLIGSGSELFEMADKKQKIYRKKAVPTPVTFGFSLGTTEALPEGAPPPQPVRLGESPRLPLDMQREADRILLARYAPPTVVVNEHMEIISTKGHTGPYLELPTGKASLNLLKMARPGLLFELQRAIEEASETGVDAVRTTVQVENGGSTNVINIRVTPFRTPLQAKHSFLVAFEEPQPPEPAVRTVGPGEPLSDDERAAKDKNIAQVKQELAATKEYLQSIIEALESTNEELQSANEEIESDNEELQSTNDELQTSKEELESANEELHTVNEEMQHRNDQLTRLNNDLSNLLNSVNLPMVMLGPDLSVRRFTPQATKVLGLTSTDVERPITRLKLKVHMGNLEQTMLDVISEVQPKQYRVKDAEGRWCELRLTPYRTTDNRIDGVVLRVLTFDEDERPKATPKKAPAAKKGKSKKRAKS
ncbi:MAG: chemotaxis protein CheB [Terriglobales bacterium]